MAKLSLAEMYRLCVETAKEVTSYEEFRNVDPQELADVALAIGKTENSQFIWDLAPNSAGARGLMQVKPVAKLQIEKNVLKIPVQPDSSLMTAGYNMFIAQSYLAYQLNRYGGVSWQKAIYSYIDGHYDPKSDRGERYFAMWQKNFFSFDYASLREQVGSDTILAGNDGTNIGNVILVALISFIALQGFNYFLKGK